MAPATPQPQSQSEEQILIARRPLGRSPAGECQRGAILLAWIVLIAPPAGGRSRGISMRNRILVALMVLMLAAPAGAIITDEEPANDTVATAPIQLFKTGGPVTIDAGEFELIAGDIDFVGIATLSPGDVVTVTTTPLEDADLEVPDTIVGVFDSSTTDPTHMILCRLDDAPNNDLIDDGGGPSARILGRGSLCRFGITAPGHYYVGVTGFRPKDPPTCDPAAPPGHPDECSSFPFDGGIGLVPCVEDDGEALTCGSYQLTIAVNHLPEPGVILQLVSGGIGLAWLNRRRNRRMTPSSQQTG